MESWDVIIIGAGFGGLCSGTLLTHADKKVLVLEKSGSIGGVAKSIVYSGQVLDDGAHIPVRAGHLESIFSDLGIDYPELFSVNESEIYHEGEWKRPGELFSADAFKEVLNIMMNLSQEELATLDDIPLNEWVESITHDPGIILLFFYLGCATSVGNRFATYSAGEMIYIIREIIESGGSLGQMAGAIKGGINSLLKPLADYINTNGGEVRLNVPVESIDIQDGRASGVKIEKGERMFHSQVLDVETIKADLVITALPVWDLFSVLCETDFPTWWVDWVNWISNKVSQAWSIIYSLDEPLFSTKSFRWIPKLPHSGFSGLFFPMPSYGDEVNQYQFHVSYQGHYDEMPNLFNRKSAQVRREIRNTLAVLEQESIELYPQLKDAYHWRVAHAGIYGIAQSPGFVGAKRISMKPPAVRNLFIVTSTVREARGIGMAATAKCARLAVNEIMKGE